MSYEAILYEEDAPIATITLNRPEKRNALNHALLGDILAAMDEAAANDAIKVIILKANGPAFSAGYDLDGSPYISLPEGEERWSVQSGHKHQRIIRGLYERVWDNPKVVIAQVHGYCFAGGMYLSMLCDLVIAAEDAKIGEPAIRLGGASSMPFWTWLMGPRRATDMLFTGRVLSGTEAAEWGLATRAVPAADLEATTREIALSIAEASLETLISKKEIWHTQADMLGMGAQFRYMTQMNSWLRMARPEPSGENPMRLLLDRRKEAKAKGETPAY